MWSNEWEQLSEKDKEQFARVINLLLQRTFINRDEVDAKSKNMVINKDYRFLERHLSLFKDYFRVAGWEIQVDNHYGVALLYNRYGYNHKRIDKNTTYFLYVLRLIYEEQMERLSLRKEAFTTIGEVVEKMFHLGLVDKKPADKVLKGSLSVLKNFNVIDKIEGAWTVPETRLVIYPSIIFLVTNEKINELFQMQEQEGRMTETSGEEEEDEAFAEDTFD